MISVLKVNAVFVNVVVVTRFNVGINDYSQTSVACLYLLVHLGNLGLCKVLGIEDEIFVASRITVLVSPLDIHPQNIYREPIVCKVLVAFHNHFSTYISPLAEMETKCMQQWHWSISRH